MDVIAERSDGIVLITINRPSTRNSMNAEMFAGLLDGYRSAEASDARVIVTKAAGGTFCVGADAGDLGQWIDKPLRDVFRQAFEGRQGLPSVGGDDAYLFDPLGFNRWAWEVAQIKVPMIAMVGGAAAGGGLGLALLHHFRFADTNAKFTTAFGKLGLGSELGCSTLLTRAIGQQAALDMLLTSRVVDAAHAARIGLVDRLVEPEELEAAVMAYADEIGRLPISATRAAVETLIRSRNDALRTAMSAEWERQQTLWGGKDFRAAIAAMQRKPTAPRA